MFVIINSNQANTRHATIGVRAVDLSLHFYKNGKEVFLLGEKKH